MKNKSIITVIHTHTYTYAEYVFGSCNFYSARILPIFCTAYTL